MSSTHAMPWLPVVENSTSKHNNSLDIMEKGCFSKDQFDTIACVRNGLMTLFVTVTGLMCALKIIQLHTHHHSTLHHYLIFYCAVIECVICAIHWMLSEYAQLDFAMQYLKLVQFLVVSHFYWLLATRALRKEYLTTRVLIPIFGASLIYFTVVSIMGCVYVKTGWTECFEPYWLMLSSAEFTLVQLFVVAGIYLTKRLNEISTLDSVRRSQKRDIWTIIVLFELSALAGFVYDLTLKALGNENGGCSGIFLHMQSLYSPVFGIFMLVKFIVPIWAMLIVFQPIDSNAINREDLLPVISDEGTYRSVFTSPRGGRKPKPQYRNQYPVEDHNWNDNQNVDQQNRRPDHSRAISEEYTSVN